MLEVTAKLGDRTMTVCPTVVYDDRSRVLIDTGMPGMAGEIDGLSKEAGIPEPLEAILLTHQDIDHVGGLPGFLAALPDGAEPFEVYAHEGDRDAIDGKAPMIKFSPERAAAMLGALPDAVRVPFENAFLRPTRPNVTRLLADGETLPYGGGLTVIHTPGHTPGHVSFYHRPSKTLIAADAMVVENGELQGPRPANTPDLELAMRSLSRLGSFDVEAVICFHGGLWRGDFGQRIAYLTGRV
ncbi:MBL fold metallo-hydrolase [Cohnella cellulosilytica]